MVTVVTGAASRMTMSNPPDTAVTVTAGFGGLLPLARPASQIRFQRVVAAWGSESAAAVTRRCRVHGDSESTGAEQRFADEVKVS